MNKWTVLYYPNGNLFYAIKGEHTAEEAMRLAFDEIPYTPPEIVGTSPTECYYVMRSGRRFDFKAEVIELPEGQGFPLD